MRKLFLLLIVTGLAGFAWLFFQDFSFEFSDGLKIATREEPSQPPPVETPKLPSRVAESIRVATFNIQAMGTTKMSKPHVVDYLARIAREFDVLAIQEIRSRSQDILPRFVDHINSTGREYDYVIGPRLGRSSSKEQYAYVFDRETIVVDRTQLYTVDDPDDLLHREPMVAWFHVRGPNPQEAFTFTLINIHTDPDEAQQEINVLDDVYRAVLSDGRDEDDVLVLGDFNADDRHLGELASISQMAWAISGAPTNTRSTQQYDNIVFNQFSTQEFTGRAGVFDFMRRFNLTIDQSLEISDHLPVWAEFSVYEGGMIGRVAEEQRVLER